MLNSHEKCLVLLENIRWGGIPKCPYCNSTKASAFKKRHRYHCNACFTSYSVTVGTLFHQTHVGLHKWFRALKLVLNRSRMISVRKLAEEIGVSKNTALYMIARIRKAEHEEPELLHKLMKELNWLTLD